MRIFKLASLIAGIAIFGWLLAGADIAAVAGVTARVGIFGAAAVLATFGFAMSIDAVAWALMFRSIAISGRWSLHLWLVLMVGEAFNMVTPFGAFGGEPFKALLLNRHYAVTYAEGTASLLLIQTVNSLGQVPFAVIGTILALRANVLPDTLETGIVVATAGIGLFMMLIYMAFHGRLLRRLPERMSNATSAAKLSRAIMFVREIEEQLFHFVRMTPGRSAAALLFAFLSWVMGAVEIYLVFLLLDVPLGFSDAWIVETVIILVRALTFFVPAHIGVQDGALAVAGRALTGSEEVGLALALIRRGRELFWAAIGLLFYLGFNLRDQARP